MSTIFLLNFLTARKRKERKRGSSPASLVSGRRALNKQSLKYSQRPVDNGGGEKRERRGGMEKNIKASAPSKAKPLFLLIQHDFPIALRRKKREKRARILRPTLLAELPLSPEKKKGRGGKEERVNPTQTAFSKNEILTFYIPPALRRYLAVNSPPRKGKGKKKGNRLRVSTSFPLHILLVHPRSSNRGGKRKKKRRKGRSYPPSRRGAKPP